MNVAASNPVPDRLLQTSSGVELVIPTIYAGFPEIVAAASTRNGGVNGGRYGMNISLSVGDDPASVADNRKRLLEALGMREDRVAHPGQIHGDRVVVVETGGRYPDCDALITSVPGLYLAITIADCVPMLLFDPVTKTIAAVHSGWRGSAAGILTKTIGILNGRFHIRPANLYAYIGQSAGGCCYEVGDEVAALFPGEVLNQSDNKRSTLDLKKFNHMLLLRHGIPDSQIGLSTHCTICEGELFHSYRREKERSGRMMAVIGRKTDLNGP